MIRAIYTGDTRFNVCHVFQYNEENKKFEMIDDKEIAYDFEEVMNDSDFIVFLTDGEISFQVEVKNKEIT